MPLLFKLPLFKLPQLNQHQLQQRNQLHLLHLNPPQHQQLPNLQRSPHLLQAVFQLKP
jgi:hypothetical protein